MVQHRPCLGNIGFFARAPIGTELWLASLEAGRC